MSSRSPPRLVLAAAVAVFGALGACTPATSGIATAVGDPVRGRALVTARGCHTCHTIPGISAANATVGPPLERFAERRYAGGHLNTPPNLVRFLLAPSAVTPGSPMPAVGLDVQEASDIAAFLYTLR